MEHDELAAFLAERAEAAQPQRVREREGLPVGEQLAEAERSGVEGPLRLLERAGTRGRDDGERQDSAGEAPRRVEHIVVHLAAEPLVAEGEGRDERAFYPRLVHRGDELLRRPPLLHLRRGEQGEPRLALREPVELFLQKFRIHMYVRIYYFHYVHPL